MSAAKEIRNKIDSIRNTQKITRAMQMVAASKMYKAQERMLKSQPYARKILQVINHIARGKLEYRHAYLNSRTVKTVGYIIVSTDRGLCGSLNSNLLKIMLRDIKNQQEQGFEVKVCVFGNKGLNFFKRFGGKVIGYAANLVESPALYELIGVVKVMLDAYLTQEIDELYLCYNEFINKMRYNPTIQQILPIVASDNQQEQHWDYIYEPDESQLLLDKVLTRYIESQVYRAVIENIACEQAARMLAMKNATDNATELISELNLIYHKARQATITRELSEIVAGASVL